MCGIIGCVNVDDAELVVNKYLSLLRHRGPDGVHTYTLDKKSAFGHALLGIVDMVFQPLVGKGVLVSNCEIYNWKELADKYGYAVRNDAELLLHLLDDGRFSYEELDGVFAFAYYRDGTLMLGRDLFGVKPLFYSILGAGVVFSSEAKVIEDAVVVSPGSLVTIDVPNLCIDVRDYQQDFFSSVVSEGEDISFLERLLVHSIMKRVPQGQKIGILFSGGIDSTFIAYVLMKHNIPFTCYSAGFHEEDLKYPEDLSWAKRVAEEFGFDFTFVRVDSDVVHDELYTLTDAIESNNPVKVGVALPFYFSLQKAQEDGVRVVFSGLGSEEIFAGYQRHEQSSDINKECISGLQDIARRDLYRDDLVSMHFGIEMRLPFLDRQLVRYALGLPADKKIRDGIKKYILRVVAKDIGMPQDIAFRPKRAAQYGSRFDQALEKLARRRGYATKTQYLMHINSQEMYNN